MSKSPLEEMHERYLEQMRDSYIAGDQSVVVFGLHYCITNETPIPEWLATAFDQACDKVRTLEVKSWDDVFGRPLKKGKRLARERRNLKIESDLVDAVSDRRAAGASMNKDLFNEIAEKFGISGTVASDIYYGFMNREFGD